MILSKNIKAFFLHCIYKCVVITICNRMTYSQIDLLIIFSGIVVHVTSTLPVVPVCNSFPMGAVSKMKHKVIHCILESTLFRTFMFYV